MKRVIASAVRLKERVILRWFKISIALKGIYAVIEALIGITAFFLPPPQLTSFVSALLQGELTEDPHDVVATSILQSAKGISLGGEVFAALYLTTHGLIKLILVSGLMRNRGWAYPTSLVIFGAFAAYQIYLFAFSLSIPIAILTILDLIVMWFIWKEYRVQLRHHAL